MMTGAEFAVGDQHLGLAVLEDEGDRLGVEPDVERVEDGARHRHAIGRLKRLGHIWRHDRDSVAAPNAGLDERRGEALAAL